MGGTAIWKGRGGGKVECEKVKRKGKGGNGLEEMENGGGGRL